MAHEMCKQITRSLDTVACMQGGPHHRAQLGRWRCGSTCRLWALLGSPRAPCCRSGPVQGCALLRGWGRGPAGLHCLLVGWGRGQRLGCGCMGRDSFGGAVRSWGHSCSPHSSLREQDVSGPTARIRGRAGQSLVLAQQVALQRLLQKLGHLAAVPAGNRHLARSVHTPGGGRHVRGWLLLVCAVPAVLCAGSTGWRGNLVMCRQVGSLVA